MVDWQEARLPVMDEAGCATWQEARGVRVVEHRGRYWMESAPGFFQPVHHLARLTADEASRPSRRCLGFRAVLAEPCLPEANGCMPAHLYPEPQHHTLERFSGTQRRQIRQGLRSFDLVALREPDLLLDQGLAVAQEARARNPGIPLPHAAAFHRSVLAYVEPPQGLVLAAMRGKRLLGFALCYAVDQAVYHDLVYVGDEGLRDRAPICLFHALATISARNPRLLELMHGLHVRANPGLCEYKRRLGIEVRPVPARCWMVPGLAPLLRAVAPCRHYRLTGRD